MDMHRLIFEVQQRRALWDARHPDHANRPETQRLWNAVAEATGMDGECTERNRDQYSGQHKNPIGTN